MIQALNSGHCGHGDSTCMCLFLPVTKGAAPKRSCCHNNTCTVHQYDGVATCQVTQSRDLVFSLSSRSRCLPTNWISDENTWISMEQVTFLSIKVIYGSYLPLAHVSHCLQNRAGEMIEFIEMWRFWRHDGPWWGFVHCALFVGVHTSVLRGIQDIDPILLIIFFIISRDIVPVV